jgi:hypothetical protein
MHDHNIRQEIKVTLEGDRLHQEANWQAVRELSLRKEPKVSIQDLTSRSAYLRFSDYPGLPDLIYSKPIDRFSKETYAVELETKLTSYNLSKKLNQFRQKGITDVIIIDLRKFEGNPDNWVELGSYISERLP